MIEPRIAQENTNRTNLKFIGGTENFDLWWRNRIGPNDYDTADHPLRIQRVGPKNEYLTWDVFKLPLRDNEELYSALEPAARRLTGYWNDVTLSPDDVEQIEAYLRCFAPWVPLEGEQDAEI
jgi:hypothetical protein